MIPVRSDSFLVDAKTYWDRLRDLVDGVLSDASDRCLAVLTSALAESSAPEATLVGLERYLQAVPNPREMLDRLATSPRSVEVLLKLFAGSPYLTDILLREPSLLGQLTNPTSVGDLRSRPEFVESALELAAAETTREARWAALRRFQQGELLRIGVCDFLGLLDLRSVTNQLSLLADALVQSALQLILNEDEEDCSPSPCGSEDSTTLTDHPGHKGRGDRMRGCTPSGFAVLAFGKLGGEELNYSSDIDLVFLGDGDMTRLGILAQRLNRALSDVTSHGFLYRVDLRLRPWGNAGPLVITPAAYWDYLRQQAQLWEKQALLKTRVIAGDFALGQQFLQSCQPLIFAAGPEEVRRSVWQAKKRIEQELQRRGRGWGEVKLGAGTIRDIEFIVQCLQLQYGGAAPEVRSINTLDGLVRLTDYGAVLGDEFLELSSAYVFFRVIEHALQLKHCRQTHTLPNLPEELETLARRLDFFDAAQLSDHFQQHRAAVRRIFEKYVGDAELATHRLRLDTVETPVPRMTHKDKLLDRLSEADPLIIDWHPEDTNRGQVTIVGFDQLGDLSMMCGLLLVHGFDILSGRVTTEEPSGKTAKGRSQPLRFVNSFTVRTRAGTPADRGQAPQNSELAEQRFVPARSSIPPILNSAVPHPGQMRVGDKPDWSRFRAELLDLLQEARGGRRRKAQARLTRQVSEALPMARRSGVVQSPVEIEFDNDSHPQTTVIRIAAEDTSGFLYELTNAVALLGVDVRHMEIQTVGSRVQDTLYVTDESGHKLLDPRRQQELRAAIVLIQHFTDWLPQSPAPEAALLHFQQLLEHELREPDWLERLASLQRPEVLASLARLLGVSDLFWEDFLRLQHANLFPLLTDVAGLRNEKTRAVLLHELTAELCASKSSAESRDRLNAFKDREMFRIDMRHIAEQAADFESFSRELTELAEIVLAAACELVDRELRNKYGAPQFDICASRFVSGTALAAGPRQTPAASAVPLAKTDDCRWCVVALGKLGGREIGFASDIELLFLYEAEGMTAASPTISNAEYFQHFVELFQQTIQAKRAGIFRVDLRLRPHGRAGNLAVSLEEFRRYFASDGPAWPFERQSLIKLRPVAGDRDFSQDVVARRDELLFKNARWDAVPVRAMRERQVRQLVRAGTFHAKLSPGALVDVEYLVQMLQLSHGDQQPSLRTPNTLKALSELGRLSVIPADAYEPLRVAYLFFRRLIDALRMARGSADDLTLPEASDDLFAGLARRLDCDVRRLTSDVERHSAAVRQWANALGWPIIPT